MNPEEFSPLGMYGNKEIFERRLNEGYTEVAHGSGEWIGDNRIVALWAFFHPKRFFRKVATHQHPKGYFDGHTFHGKPFETAYTEKGFKKYCENNKIVLGERQDLAKIVKIWEE
jgi:hypothetical protein